jgi:dienelactone hydrolase
VTDRPAFVPTSAGPVGAVVSEPDARPRGAVLLLHGGGGRRFGVNGVWARTGRLLAEDGWTTLRVDCPGRGDSSLADPGEKGWLRDCLRWLRDRAGSRDVSLVGVCYGARLAVEAAADPDIGGLFLTVPYLRSVSSSPLGRALRRLATRASLPHRARFDPRVKRATVAAARRVPTRILVGALDTWLPDAVALQRAAGPAAAVRLDVVPGVALHQYRTMLAQEVAIDRIRGWARELAT